MGIEVQAVEARAVPDPKGADAVAVNHLGGRSHQAGFSLELFLNLAGGVDEQQRTATVVDDDKLVVRVTAEKLDGHGICNSVEGERPRADGTVTKLEDAVRGSDQQGLVVDHLIIENRGDLVPVFVFEKSSFRAVGIEFEKMGVGRDGDEVRAKQGNFLNIGRKVPGLHDVAIAPGSDLPKSAKIDGIGRRVVPLGRQ
jgi:hypothetical protein